MRINFIKKIFFLFLRAKIKFGNPSKNSLIIFDDVSLNDFKHVLKNREYTVMYARHERIKTIYFSFSVLLYTIKNFKGNLFTSYLLALIKIIKPKIILTTIDNSFKFSEIAKQFYKKITFIAVQNAARYDFERNKLLFDMNHEKHKHNNQRYFIPNYYCFSNYEKKICKKYNINVLKFCTAGSLRLSNYVEYLRNSKLKINEKKYHVALVSESSTAKNKLWQRSGPEEGFAKIAKFTIRLCMKHNLRFIFVKKRQRGPYQIVEMRWYKKFLNKEEFGFLLKNSLKVSRMKFSAYKAAHQSIVTIGICSTLLRETLALNGKILACNFTGLKFYNFPIRGICSLNNPSFKKFEKRVFKIMKLKENKYFSSIKNKQLIEMDKNNLTFERLNKNINQILSK